MFADVSLARRIERAEAGMSAAMVGAVSRRTGRAWFVEPVGEGCAIYAGPGSPLNKIIGAGLDGGAIDEAALGRAEQIFESHGEAARAEVCVLANPIVFAVFNRRGYRFESVERVLWSPQADLAFEAGDYYQRGHPGLRFGDCTDGYIWSAPLEAIRLVSLISLETYAPDAASRARVAHRNPLTDDVDVSDARLREIWAAEAAKRGNVLASRGWAHLAGWKAACR